MKSRLDQCRIAEEREHAAEVARGVEEVGIAGGGVTGVGEPLLDEGRGSADHEKGQPHREGEQDEHVEDGIGFAAAQESGIHGEGQDGKGKREQGEMEEHLGAEAEPGRARMGVGIAAEERRLKEDHAGAPHGWGSAEEREDHLAHHRLHHEEEGGAGEHRDRVEEEDCDQIGILAGHRGAASGVVRDSPRHPRSPTVRGRPTS